MSAPQSAQQKVQQHPAVIQATDKFHYYIAQLDKEVSNVVVSCSLSAI